MTHPFPTRRSSDLRTRHLFDPQAQIGGPAAVISRNTSRAGERRMKGELRILGAAHGLLLGLVLAAPLVAPALLPWGAEALFIVAALQLRLAEDRKSVV